MVEAENLAAIPSSAFAAVNANSGFVQLPTDAQRSAAIGYERAYARARPLKQSTDEAAAAWRVAVRAALSLHAARDDRPRSVRIRTQFRYAQEHAAELPGRSG